MLCQQRNILFSIVTLACSGFLSACSQKVDLATASYDAEKLAILNQNAISRLKEFSGNNNATSGFYDAQRNSPDGRRDPSGSNADGPQTPTTPLAPPPADLPTAQSCAAYSLALRIQGAAPAAAGTFNFDSTLKYQIISTSGSSIAVSNGAQKVSFEYQYLPRYTVPGSANRSHEQLGIQVKNFPALLNAAALTPAQTLVMPFSADIHFCQTTDHCDAGSADRVFSFRVNHGSMGSPFTTPNQSVISQNIYTHGVSAYQSSDGAYSQFCFINLKVPGNDPLVVDLGKGVVLGDPSQSKTLFDLTGDGIPERISCVQEGAFIALPDSQGLVQNINQLFGDNTVGPDRKKAANGFLALAKFDSDHDGFITEKDEIFSKLRLWKDSNCDGHSQLNELSSLRVQQISKIDLHYSEMFEADSFGNETRQRSVVQKDNGKLFQIFDVWFARQP